jgi:2-methylcitrate dehydratase PrpD
VTSAHPSLTESLTRLIREKPITSSDLDTASLFVLDAVANAVAGRQSEPGKILRRWCESQGTATPSALAFTLGGLTHILETDDLHRESVVHPGCVVVPAVCAWAATHDVSGRDVLIAALHGFEAACRVGMAVGSAHYKIWHNTATCGPYGSAMALAHLLQLNERQCVDALGNAGTQSAGLWQFIETGAMTKHLHAGRAAQAGLLASELAALGLTGPPQILEGKKGFFAAACPDADPSAVLHEPKAPWQLTRTSIKPWPSCRHTHPAVDAALELKKSVDRNAVAEIRVETYQAAIDVCDRPNPTSEYEAKFSLQHCVAAALALPSVDFSAFGPEARRGLAAQRQLTRLTVVEPYRSAYPRAWGSAVSVKLKSGETRRVAREHAKGDPDAPLSRADLIEKARMLFEYGGATSANENIESILALARTENASNVIAKLTRLCLST